MQLLKKLKLFHCKNSGAVEAGTQVCGRTSLESFPQGSVKKHLSSVVLGILDFLHSTGDGGSYLLKFSSDYSCVPAIECSLSVLLYFDCYDTRLKQFNRTLPIRSHSERHGGYCRKFFLCATEQVYVFYQSRGFCSLNNGVIFLKSRLNAFLYIAAQTCLYHFSSFCLKQEREGERGRADKTTFNLVLNTES